MSKSNQDVTFGQQPPKRRTLPWLKESNDADSKTHTDASAPNNLQNRRGVKKVSSKDQKGNLNPSKRAGPWSGAFPAPVTKKRTEQEAFDDSDSYLRGSDDGHDSEDEALRETVEKAKASTKPRARKTPRIQTYDSQELLIQRCEALEEEVATLKALVAKLWSKSAVNESMCFTRWSQKIDREQEEHLREGLKRTHKVSEENEEDEKKIRQWRRDDPR